MSVSKVGRFRQDFSHVSVLSTGCHLWPVILSWEFLIFLASQNTF